MIFTPKLSILIGFSGFPLFSPSKIGVYTPIFEKHPSWGHDIFAEPSKGVPVYVTFPGSSQGLQVTTDIGWQNMICDVEYQWQS